jgi:hypothetical protein
MFALCCYQNPQLPDNDAQVSCMAPFLVLELFFSNYGY